ncbi:hypothetical protein DMENIID0001_051860 [Sergentomyia squamirostris]
MASCRGGSDCAKEFVEGSVAGDCISSQIDRGGLTPHPTSDYKGGLLSDYGGERRKREPPASIPFDSSGGFGNTLKVLVQSVSSPKRTDNYSPTKYLHSISEESEGHDDLTLIPTELELELEATARIRELTNSAENQQFRDFLTNFCSHRDVVENSVIPADCDQPNSEQCDSDGVCEDILKTKGESPDYLYHIAKESTGNLYLRVIRHLRDNRGNFSSTYPLSRNFCITLNFTLDGYGLYYDEKNTLLTYIEILNDIPLQRFEFRGRITST